MKILVTGATGQLGYDVCRVLADRGVEHTGVGSRDCDISDRAAVRALLVREAPDAVIHCAAYTKVEQAEDEPELCRAVNAEGTRNIAEACRDGGAKLLYISTDYVFGGEGDRPYETDAKTGPLNVYGQTKLEGEEIVRELLTRRFIVRISWVFGIHGKNFVRTMLELGARERTLRITGDQIGSPTYTRDLAPLLCDMVETERYGTYHATNEGFCSWAEFADEIFRCAGMDVEVAPRPTSERPGKAVRPYNSRLSKAALTEAGFARLPPWQDAVARYIRELSST